MDDVICIVELPAMTWRDETAHFELNPLVCIDAAWCNGAARTQPKSESMLTAQSIDLRPALEQASSRFPRCLCVDQRTIWYSMMAQEFRKSIVWHARCAYSRKPCAHLSMQFAKVERMQRAKLNGNNNKSKLKEASNRQTVTYGARSYKIIRYWRQLNIAYNSV